MNSFDVGQGEKGHTVMGTREREVLMLLIDKKITLCIIVKTT
jgi:hypothetical protein